jgi:hypothetical protein
LGVLKRALQFCKLSTALDAFEPSDGKKKQDCALDSKDQDFITDVSALQTQ